jgi:hypothetical protein
MRVRASGRSIQMIGAVTYEPVAIRAGTESGPNPGCRIAKSRRLRLLYFATLRRGTGQLTELRMVPMQARKMRLHQARPADSKWLATILDQISRAYGSQISLDPGGTLSLDL